jgi:HSP20 family protein
MAEEAKKEVTTGKPKEIQKAAPARTLSPFEEMDRWFESFFPRGWMRPMRWEWPELPAAFEGRMPRVDVIDREAEIVVRAEVPGVDKKDLDVSVTENAVTIQGSTRHEEKEERENYYRREITRGAFSRTVALPGDVDSSKAKASFKEGVLELTIPKVEKAKRRSVTID